MNRYDDEEDMPCLCGHDFYEHDQWHGYTAISEHLPGQCLAGECGCAYFVRNDQ